MTTDILQGWNAIADFLSCDVRTAKRWEQHKGLPVRRTRRTPGEGRPNVYARISELEEWRASAGPLDIVADASGPDLPFTSSAAAAPPSLASSESSNRLPSARPRTSWYLPLAITAVIVIFATAAVAVWAHAHRPHTAASVDIPAPETSHLSANPASGSHAEELYLQGSYLLEQRTPETLQQARVDFGQAIAANSNYAPAYAGLARAYDLLREYATMPSAQAYPLAKQAALQAIALDPHLPDAHAALGYEEFFWEWNGPAAEHEFKQAIALDPHSVTALHWYGAMLMHQARFAEALDQLNRAQAIAPSSTGVLGTRAYAIGLAGRRNEAADLLQDILTRVPDSAPLHFILAQLSLQEPRDIPRYLDQTRRVAELRHSPEDTGLVKAAESAYRQGGESAMWRAILDNEHRRHPAPNHPTYLMVQCEAALGLHNDVIRDLEQLEQDHNELMIGLDIDAMLAPLHDDPAFQRIVAQVGLPNPAPHTR